jgi:hypothetical protein
MKKFRFKLKLLFARIFVNQDLPDFICISELRPRSKHIKHENLYYYSCNGSQYIREYYLEHKRSNKYIRDLFIAIKIIDTRLKETYKSRHGESYQEIFDSIPQDIKHRLKFIIN